MSLRADHPPHGQPRRGQGWPDDHLDVLDFVGPCSADRRLEHLLQPLPGAGTGAGITAKATCQRPARSRVTR
jgi:hypothetical protein